MITSVAGNGVFGSSGDGGPATGAQLFHPSGVAVDAANNLYIADYFSQVVRKVSNGVIAPFAGNGTFGFSGDNGAATNAELGEPYGIALDAEGDRLHRGLQ